MKVLMSCGKGGVGKTFSSSALALNCARAGHKTALVDYDGGHSVAKTFALTQTLKSNVVQKIEFEDNLFVAVIDNTHYFDIKTAQKSGEPTAQYFRDYMAQFPEDLGLMGWADLPSSFWGVPTEPEALQRYLTLVMVLTRLKEQKFEYVFVDIEPTAGFKRMIQAGPIIAAGLKNLDEQGKMIVMLIGAKWPDIRQYIESDYVIDSNDYMDNMLSAAAMIRDANYFLVTVAEESPVGQTFSNRQIIEAYGGQATGCIVNNLRGEPHEDDNIALLKAHGLPISRIGRCPWMHYPGGAHRFDLLAEVGAQISNDLGLTL